MRMSAPCARLVAAATLGLSACGERAQLPVSAGVGPNPTLPPPNETLFPTVNVAPAEGWPAGARPTPAPGLEVAAFAEDLDHPRWLHVLPNGDVLVAETNAPPRPEDNEGIRGWVMSFFMARAGAGVPSADRITLLRDVDGDGTVDQRTAFLDDLHSPFGMALVGDVFYVANTDAVVRFPYQEGQTEITEPGEKVVDLPGGPLNHHWTKGLIATPDGTLLYAAVGSNSNVAENGITVEWGRAAIWEIDPATGRHRVFASGLRNPVGMDWQPETGVLWTVVNERDGLGSDLVPDYLTSVEDGGFYGWPYSYFGDHVDERVQPPRPDLVAQAIVPDYALGAHTASLGLTFAEGNSLPPTFASGAFVGQHGSWNRDPHSGYKVIFVPFENGEPAGEPVDVLTGFLSDDEKALGRPVGVAIDGQGALLVADDVGNKVWRVTAADAQTAQAGARRTP
jgi:glucose/arabinose dehydrogenase